MRSHAPVGRVSLTKRSSVKELRQTQLPAHKLTFSRRNIGRYLHQLEKTRKRCKEVSHDLTAKRQKNMCKFVKTSDKSLRPLFLQTNRCM